MWTTSQNMWRRQQLWIFKLKSSVIDLLEKITRRCGTTYNERMLIEPKLIYILHIFWIPFASCLSDGSLMIDWRTIWKKILKPWKGLLCFHFHVCLSVCPRATEHTFWLKNLIFWLKDPWDMRQNCIFFFEILKIELFGITFTCFFSLSLYLLEAT